MIDRLDVSVYAIPLDAPESDGTLTWDRTTAVVVEVGSGDATGIGYTYGSKACAAFIDDMLRDVVLRSEQGAGVVGVWSHMVRAIRNQGRPGITSMSISAIDAALWDLEARVRGVPLFRLLGAARDRVPVYGSGGFTSLSDDALQEQLGGWIDELGIPRVKIKIGEEWGTREERDLDRVALARKVIGDAAELYVDANGGYSRKQAVRVAGRMRDHGVTWFEEPVSSDDLAGLREIRDLIDIDVTAGEYGYDLAYFQRMLAAGAVDCVQVDVTRCGGITEMLRIAALAAAHGLDVSAHCAPSLSADVCAAIPNFRHLEYFADHARAERLLFDGVLDPTEGDLVLTDDRAGNGLELKRSDAERYRVA